MEFAGTFGAGEKEGARSVGFGRLGGAGKEG